MKKLLFLPLLFFVLACSSDEEAESTTTLIEQQGPKIATKYTLTINAGEGGTLSSEGGTYDEGTEITIVATPEEGYEFVRWDGFDGIDADKASLTITLNSNTTFEAIFVKATSLNNGLIETCKLKYDPPPAVGLGFPRYEYSMRSTGNLKMTLIFVDFNDSLKSRYGATTEITTVKPLLSKNLAIEITFSIFFLLPVSE